MNIVRTAILKELKDAGLSHYWLAKHSKVRPATVYDFLNGKAGAKVETAERLMEVLGLEIVSSLRSPSGTVGALRKRMKKLSSGDDKRRKTTRK